MFSRELYEKYGGFDTSLDYLEDWDLWVRYSQGGAFACVEKTTSLYKVPYERKIQHDRQKKLDSAFKVVHEKHQSYLIPVSAAKLSKYGKLKIRGKIMLQIQSVIYGNEIDALMKAVRAIGQAVKVYHKNVGELKVKLVYGDASPKPTLNGEEINQILALLDGEVEFEYNFFEFNSGTAKGHNIMAKIRMRTC